MIKRPSLRVLLQLQVGYFALALIYNITAYIFVLLGQKALAGGSPIAATIVVALLSLTVATGFLRWMLAYRVLMGLMTFLALQAEYLHLTNLLNDGFANYHSPVAWALAFCLIAYGAVVFLLGAMGYYSAAPVSAARQVADDQTKDARRD